MSYYGGYPINSSVADGVVAVTPSDSTVLQNVRAVFVGTGGNIAMVVGGVTITFKNVANGQILPVAPTKVMLTNTTAADIIGLT